MSKKLNLASLSQHEVKMNNIRGGIIPIMNCKCVCFCACRCSGLYSLNTITAKLSVSPKAVEYDGENSGIFPF